MLLGIPLHYTPILYNVLRSKGGVSMKGGVVWIAQDNLRNIDRNTKAVISVVLAAETMEDKKELEEIMRAWLTGKEIQITIKNPNPKISTGTN